MLRALSIVNVFALLLLSSVVLAQPAAPPTDIPLAAPVAPVGGTAPPLQACAVKAFDEYAGNMSIWERQWADSVAASRPELISAAMARVNAHNSALQRDSFRIRYLAANLPDDLNLDETIASLRLFDWTPQEEQALRTSETDYPGVADNAEHDRQAADAQPKADELENYFEETFTQTAGAGLAHRLSEILAQGNDALATCHKTHIAQPKPDAPPASASASAAPVKF